MTIFSAVGASPRNIRELTSSFEGWLLFCYEKKKPLEPTEKQPGWLNKRELCLSIGISQQAIDKWGVPPKAKLGREVFFLVSDVIDNRLRHESKNGDENNNQEAKLEGEKLRLEKLKEEVHQLKLRNAVLEGKSLPAGGVIKVLAKILSQSGDLLDSLSLSIKRKFPDLDKRIIDSISETTIKYLFFTSQSLSASKREMFSFVDT